jgi:hypothetical protein
MTHGVLKSNCGALHFGRDDSGCCCAVEGTTQLNDGRIQEEIA